MAKNIVYYFTGTGNSYYVAKKMSDALNGEMIPFLMLKNEVDVEADVLVFVFPVYDFKPPKIVNQIIDNLSSIRANKIVAIATYGVALSSTLKHFETTLSRIGATLSYGYGIKCPHNAVGSIGIKETENRKRLMLMDNKIKDILTKMAASSSGKIERTTLFEDGTLIKGIPHIINFLIILILKGSASLSYKVTEACVKCHLCENICPVGAIEWNQEIDSPIFGNQCASCFACVQWCPQKAIQFGDYGFKELGMIRYHHPKVNAENLITRSRS
jgi:ferredoxin